MVEVYDPIALEHYLAAVATECVRLRARLESACGRSAAADALSCRSVSLDSGQEEVVRAGLEAERLSHERALLAVAAKADAEVDQVLAEAQAESDAIKAAVRRLAPAPVSSPPAPRPARVPAVTISAPQAAPTMALGRRHGSLVG